MIWCLLPVFLILMASAPAPALEPTEIVVIANGRVKDSVILARQYMRARSIPANHLLVLSTTGEEECQRQQYNREIRVPVADFVRTLREQTRIRCLVTMYGLPLKIAPLAPAEPDTHTTRAAVDSELALVLAGNYPLAGWQPNPYFLGFQHRPSGPGKDQVLMVSRLDGPDTATVRRIIRDSLTTERRHDLTGAACFDARWPRPRDQRGLGGYRLYDRSLYRAAERLRAQGRLPVIVNGNEKLFAAGECPSPALYCGWYSLARYIDVFTWPRGAVGYHIASAECSTLKQPKSEVWCKQMLEHGVAATVGPVYEPFVQGFPLPEIFFPALNEGYLSLAEAWLISQPSFSWQMILIGDPMYQPFPPLDQGENPLEKQEEKTYLIHMHENRQDRSRPLPEPGTGDSGSFRSPSASGTPAPQGGRP